MELIGMIIFIGVVYVLCKLPEWKYDNRLCPPGKTIDWAKANHDLVMGMDKQEYFRKYNSGYYDIDKK